MDSFLMISAFVLLSMLLACTGVLMLLSPRRFAAACEAFTAAGNLPSLLPQSVKGALLQVRTVGCCFVGAGLILMGGTAGLTRSLLLPGGMEGVGKMYWLIVPAALGISAGYVILAYGTTWVENTFGKWFDHPLVPQEIIIALTWELRIAGVAFTLFGLGAISIWLRALIGR
jgi:hypothetical protein